MTRTEVLFVLLATLGGHWLFVHLSSQWHASLSLLWGCVLTGIVMAQRLEKERGE